MYTFAPTDNSFILRRKLKQMRTAMFWLPLVFIGLIYTVGWLLVGPERQHPFIGPLFRICPLILLSTSALALAARFLHAEDSRRGALVCYGLNYLVMIVWLPALWLLSKSATWLFWPFSLFAWAVCLLLVNRMNLLLYARWKPDSCTAQRIALPFEYIVHQKQVLGFLAVFISVAQLALLFVSLDMPHYLFHTATDGRINWDGIWIALMLLPFGVGLLCPVFCTRPTANPSAWQRINRQILLWSLNWLRLGVTPPGFKAQLNLYKWWLSHPNEPYPAELMDKLKQTEPEIWQDDAPAQPLAQLAIGSRAGESKPAQELPASTHITPLLRAVMDHDTHTLNILLPNTEELNRPFAVNGNTPLHIAAWNGYTDVVELLLAQPGIDKNAKNLAGKTPLDLAKEKNFPDIIALLQP